MSAIPIAAKVECADGSCGKSTNVILNPVTKEVTHVVVEDESLPNSSTRIVPIASVADSTPKQIRLSCTKADVAKMPPFLTTQLIRQSGSGQAYASGEAFSSQYVFNDTAYDGATERNIPAGELAICSGMAIEATDGKLGMLDELVLDPKSGDLTHLLMRRGHLRGKKEVAVPVSAVDFIDSDTIHLNIDKEAGKALPPVSTKRPD